MRTFLIILFGVLTIICLIMAGFSEKVITAFVYVLFALLGGFITSYLAIGNMPLR